MSFVRRGSAEIHYEVFDSEDGSTDQTIVLIPGLSANSRSFPTTVDGLRQRRRVIAIDPRGAGLTSPRFAPFTIRDIADDVAAVLDVERIDSADVLGISMGGMIAQEFALSRADRLRRLVLCCTTCGRTPGVRPSPELIVKLVRGIAAAKRQPDSAAIARSFGQLLFSSETPIERQVRFFAPRLGRGRPTKRGVLSQLLAVRTFATHDRLGDLRAPTLVIHGEQDILVPTVNARILADAIPGAQIAVLPGAHVFFFEHEVPFLDRVREFLDSGPEVGNP